MASSSGVALSALTQTSCMSDTSASFTSDAPRSRDISTTSFVISGVTFGLPSRSPPIQLANRTGATSGGRGFSMPGAACISASIRRR